MSWNPLTDGYVFLDSPAESDIDRITQCCQDPEVQRWTRIPQPYTRADSRHFVREWVYLGRVAGTRLDWAIRLEPGGTLMGVVGLNNIADGAAEVGYWLAAEARGKGVMARALRLAIDHAFDTDGRGLHHLTWQAHVGNWASRRAAWRVGFRVEGTVRRLCPQRGQWRDGWIATLLRDDPRTPTTAWLDVPTLPGNGVVLRRFVQADAQSVVEACNDPETRHWLGRLPNPYTHEVAAAYIESREEEHASGQGVHWAAASPAGGPAVGSFSLMRLADNSAEIGYWVHPAARGRGVATEAVRLVAAHACAPAEAGGLGLHRLRLAHAVGNEASGRVADRAGFTRTGLEHRATPLGDGSFADLVWYERLAR